MLKCSGLSATQLYPRSDTFSWNIICYIIFQHNCILNINDLNIFVCRIFTFELNISWYPRYFLWASLYINMKPQVKSHHLLSGARAPLGPRRDAGVSKGPAEGPSFFCPGGRKIFWDPERRPSQSSNWQNFAIFETLDFQNIGLFTHFPSTLCNKASEIHI